MVFPIMVASKMVACGGQRKHWKVAALHCCRSCCSYCLAKGHGWVAGIERRLPVMMRVELGDLLLSI